MNIYNAIQHMHNIYLERWNKHIPCISISNISRSIFNTKEKEFFWLVGFYDTRAPISGKFYYEYLDIRFFMCECFVDFYTYYILVYVYICISALNYELIYLCTTYIYIFTSVRIYIYICVC